MGKDTIKQLDTREQCRTKLPIWFGSRSNYTHGLKEVLANAIDEISNNFHKGVIEVTLEDDLQTISVKDSGRGVPISGKTDGKPNYVLLFETLFAGTNYDNNENGKIATGTNGVGTCTLNHTSELFEVTSSRNGEVHKLIYNDGGRFVSFEKIGKSTESYSIFRFKLDKEMYTNVIYDPNEVKNICRYNAASNSKVEIRFIHNGNVETFHYPSILYYFDEISTNVTSKKVVGGRKSYTDSIQHVENGEYIKETNTLEVILATSSEPIQQTFLNSTYLPEHGSIYDGVVAGARGFINKYCRDNKLLDKKLGNISKEDIEESLSFVASLQSTYVEFANQTKLSTSKSLYKDVAQGYTYSLLEVQSIENSKEFEKLIKHILEVQKFNSKAQANKKALKKKLSEKIDSISNRVEGLVDCKHHGEESELYIAEGKSALGSIALARNSKNQAVIPIRGKILNCLKASYDTIFKSEIILDIVKALGCGIETDKKNKDLGSFDIKNLRYGKIMLAADADADGEQIVCLLLTMIYKLMPTLIHQGRVYIVNTPLYEVRLKDDSSLYWNSESEKDEYILKNGDSKIKHISRCKGLGEMTAEVMAETGMNPETRNVTQVTIDDVESMQRAFEVWMNTDVTLRKSIIETELNKCEDLD